MPKMTPTMREAMDDYRGTPAPRTKAKPVTVNTKALHYIVEWHDVTGPYLHNATSTVKDNKVTRLFQTEQETIDFICAQPLRPKMTMSRFDPKDTPHLVTVWKSKH